MLLLTQNSEGQIRTFEADFPPFPVDPLAEWETGVASGTET
ncbi:MAG: hypothetical protein V7723_14660 [Sneathiella sp.]